MITDARAAHPMVSVRRLCALHDVGRCWYVYQQGRDVEDRDQPLADDIGAIVLKWSGMAIAGSPMSWPAEGVQPTTSASCPTGRAKPVPRRVMRERRLLCRPKRRYQHTTDSSHSETKFPNLLPHVIPSRPDQGCRPI